VRDLVLHGIVSQSNRPSIINGVRFYDRCSNINCCLSRSKKASNIVFSRVERSGTSGKTLNFSHEWKKSQIFNKDECKDLFLPFPCKNLLVYLFFTMEWLCQLILHCGMSMSIYFTLWKDYVYGMTMSINLTLYMTLSINLTLYMTKISRFTVVICNVKLIDKVIYNVRLIDKVIYNVRLIDIVIP
jgi:hypothetical protein